MLDAAGSLKTMFRMVVRSCSNQLLKKMAEAIEGVLKSFRWPSPLVRCAGNVLSKTSGTVTSHEIKLNGDMLEQLLLAHPTRLGLFCQYRKLQACRP